MTSSRPSGTSSLDKKGFPVKLSHFINPNRFWVIDLKRTDLIKKLRERESKDFAAYENRRNLCGKAKQGDLVAYKVEHSNKWIRCVVDDVVHQQNKAILWAVDYGKPLATSHPEKLLKIDFEETRLVINAGLAVLPAEEYFNEQTKKVEMHVVELWSDEALNLFEKLASTATETYFVRTEDVRDGEISFGEVVVRMESKEFNIASELVRLKLAVHVPSQKFLRTFNATTASITDRWDDNLNQGGVLNTPDFIEVDQIASESGQDHPFLFKYLQKRAEQDLIIAENDAASSFSITKVSQWLKYSSGINHDDNDTVDIDKVLLSESRPLAHVSPTSRSRCNTLRQKSGGTSHSSRAKLQTGGSDGQQTSSQSEVPSINTPSGGHDLSFGSFLKKKQVDKGDGKKLYDLLNFMKEMKRPRLTSQAGNEAWMSLDEGAVYPVMVTAFESVNSFYVQLVDEDDGWSELAKKLDNFESPEPLLNSAVGMLCLVEANLELHRAKIIRKSDFTTLCFCVDSGVLVYFQNEMERVYQIPDDILNHMPFQAISCRLAGIKAPRTYTWTGTIYQKVVKRIQQQRVRVVQQIEPNMDQLELTGIRCYDVILLDNGPKNEDINVNDLLVQYQLAEIAETEEFSTSAANKTF